MTSNAPRLDSRVLNRIIDLIFPTTAHTNETVTAAGEEARRVYEKTQREAAAKKIQDWRRLGKPWSAMMKRFGEGVLLLLPKSLSDEK